MHGVHSETEQRLIDAYAQFDPDDERTVPDFLDRTKYLCLKRRNELLTRGTQYHREENDEDDQAIMIFFIGDPF